MQSEDPLLLEVRREHVLMDAIAIIRYSQEDLHNPLQIKFCGEQGVDVGGLRREFWSLFLYQLSHSIFVTGKEGRLSFQPNFLERKKNTFFHLGQLVALSILQDGPGAPIFSECITDYILNGKSNSLDPDDLMEGPKEILEKMATCSSEDELQQQYMTITDYATDAGFLLPVRRFTEKHVPTLQACLIENQVVSCKEELDQFIKGLDTHQLISALQQEGTREKCRGLFSGKIKPVTAAAIRQLLKFKYTDGNKRQQEMVTGQGFLTFLQATKGSGATVNGINLKPKDVLMWLTGATHIPACGFHKSIDVEFGSTTNINTCALCLTLEVKESMTLDEAVTYYTELLINSQTFSKE
ncbi:uncharacterized protein LOC133198297 [Saccostrea echinata]|uniref:uncharacterized protein LOC133198297 n=1 Tax=Saccostrea echinata TaxID=191078 RepID=UPI002A800C99|nr:uncharacterized protein LOC133198297 [Saccostrea echinata]